MTSALFAGDRLGGMTVHVFLETGGEIDPAWEQDSAAASLELDRYAPFIKDVDHLPRIVAEIPLAFESWAWVHPGVPAPSECALRIFMAASGRPLLVLSVTFELVLDYGAVIGVLEDLYYWCDYQTETGKGRGVRVDGLPLRSRLMEQVPLVEVPTRQVPARHLLLTLGREYPELDGDRIHRVVYRHDVAIDNESDSILMPAELNRRSDTQGAVSPYVSFLRGTQPYVETACMLSTVALVAAVSDLRDLRASAMRRVEQLRDIATARPNGGSKDPERDLSKLDAADIELAFLELNLSAWVEAQTDWGLELPSLRQRDYHRCLAEVLSIDEIAKRQSRLHARLRDAIGSQRAYTRATEGVAEEVRRGRLTRVVSAVSVVALPLTVALAFLGANIAEVDAQASIIDVRYLPIYGLSVGIFLMAVAIALAFSFLLERSARRRLEGLERALRRLRERSYRAPRTAAGVEDGSDSGP